MHRRHVTTISFLIMAMVVLSTGAYADNIIYTTPPSVTYCINTTDSAHIWTYFDDEAAPAAWEDHYKNLTCAHGCEANTGECYRDPNDVGLGDLGIMFGVLGIAFLFLYIAQSMDDERWVLQLMLLLLGLFLVIADVGIFQSIAEGLNDTEITAILQAIYMVVVFVTIILVFYYILLVIVKVINALDKETRLK